MSAKSLESYTYSDLETLLGVLDAASEEAHAEDEQQVTQDGPQERRLYDLRGHSDVRL
jgi:hypothetical protein